MPFSEPWDRLGPLQQREAYAQAITERNTAQGKLRAIRARFADLADNYQEIDTESALTAVDRIINA